MRNRFMKEYFSKNQVSHSYLDKNIFKNYVKNANNANFLVYDKISNLKYDIRNKYHNNPKNLNIKCKYLPKQKLSNTKIGQNIDTSSFNNKHVLREFESLFEKTTNNNIANYFNGQELDQMSDFIKRIKVFNNNNFMKKLKRKKSKNKKIYNNDQSRDLSTKPYNYKGNTYSFISSRKSLNKYNCSDIYLSTTNASAYENTLVNESNNNYRKHFSYLKLDLDDYLTFNPIKRELNFDFKKTGRNRNSNLSQYKNEVERIKLFGNKGKVRNFSYNPKIKSNDVDKLIYNYRTLKNLI